MLKLCTQNVSKAKLGTTHGLDLEALFSQQAPAVAQAVTNLYANRNTEGAWSKWLNLGHNPQLLKALETYCAQIKGQYDDLVVLGIGGSSLGGFALLKALLHPYWNQLSSEQRNGYPRFHFVENVDGDQMAGLFDALDLSRTLFNVISKSGSTAESMAAFMYAKARVDEQLGDSPDTLYRHFVITTDATTGILRPIVNQYNLASFEVPDDVGGRFSIFSAVGLLPAAICGLNPADFQRGIAELEPLLSNPDIRQNPAAQNAVIQLAYYHAGKPISVFMPYSTRLSAVADWYVQLWAESLGKAQTLDGKTVNVGPTPLKAVGATDQHSQVQLYNEGPFDKVFTFIEVAAPDKQTLIPNSLPAVEPLAYLAGQSFHKLLSAEFEATRAALTRNQRPNVTVTLPQIDSYYFAQLLTLFEVQTALAGALLNIDPFDQPGVELAKQYTYALMGRKGFEHLLAEAKGELPVGV